MSRVNCCSVIKRLPRKMVIDPFSSQLDLYHRSGADDEHLRKKKKRMKSSPSEGKYVPKVTFGKVWRVLKTLNSNRRLCLEWLWSKKKTSSKDKGYGALITDEERR